jgi:hypothetical protein
MPVKQQKKISNKKGGSIASNSVAKSLVNTNTYNKLGGSSKKGGSIASNSVAKSLVNANTYKSINSSNKLGGSSKKGGSIASNSVANELVNTNTYKQMNVRANNRVGSCNTGGKRGGTLVPQNMNAFNNTNSYKLRNKKGGDANSAPFKIGLDYSAIPVTGSQYGDYVNRSTPNAVLNYMAEESPISSLAMSKSVMPNLGGVTNNIVPFNYGTGGKKTRKVRKARKV